MKFDSSSCLPLQTAIPCQERWIYLGQFEEAVPNFVLLNLELLSHTLMCSSM